LLAAGSDEKGLTLSVLVGVSAKVLGAVLALTCHGS
jgi:hypothetical protein